MAGEESAVIFSLDAGATTARAIIVDSRGTLLWCGEEKGASPTYEGVDAATGMAASLWRRACGTLEGVEERIAAFAGGFAGGRSVTVRSELTSSLYQILSPDVDIHNLPVTVTDDAHIALLGALGENGPGCVVISGTGSICMIRDGRGVTTLTGGWGWPLGDEGSAKWVGWMAVRKAMTAWEEDVHTGLAELVSSEWDLGDIKENDTYELMRAAVKVAMDPEKFGKLAPGVLNLARNGDLEAVELVSETGRVLGELIRRGCNRLELKPGKPLPASFMGSLARAWSAELEIPVKESAGECGKDLEFVTPEMPAEGGAALLAFRTAGIDLGSEEIERLSEQLSRPGEL